MKKDSVLAFVRGAGAGFGAFGARVVFGSFVVFGARALAAVAIVAMINIGACMAESKKIESKTESKKLESTKVDSGTASGLREIEIQGVKIPVVYEVSDMIPMGRISLVFRGGGRLSNGGKAGLDVLRDTLLDEGTKALGGTAFASALEQKAISLIIGSSEENLSFKLEFLKEQEEAAIALLGELLRDPNLTTKALNKSKTAIISQILANQNDFDFIADELLRAMLFEGTPMAESKLGSIKQIEGYSLKDIRASLDNALQLQKLSIIVGGDVKLDNTLGRLSEMLSFLPQGSAYERAHFEVSAKNATRTQDAQTQQAYIYFGAPLKFSDFEKEAYLAKVAGFILGSGGFGSRLMEEVRVKRGLAYGAYISYNTALLVSFASGHLQTKLESKDEAIALVKKVVKDFVKNGATQKELDSAKSFLLGSEPMRNETLEQRLQTKSLNFYRGLPLDFDKRQLQQIRDLDLKTLNAYIKAHDEVADLSFAIVTDVADSSTKGADK